MSEPLAPCPCGKAVESLSIMEGEPSGKWAWVSGNCCGEWSIEFRAEYNALDSDDCKRLAREAWNRAPRGAS